MVVPKFQIPRDSTKAGSCFLHCFWIGLHWMFYKGHLR